MRSNPGTFHPTLSLRTGAYVFFIVLSQWSYSQVWTPVTGLPTTVGLKTVKFISASTGWAAGEDGTIIKTTNGGMTWDTQASGTTNTLRSIFFLDASNGWACGSGGTIIATTDGGENWTAQTSPYTSQYNTVRFANTTTGWIVGIGNVLLKTTNGGMTWTQQSNQGVSMWGLDVQSTTTAWACGGFNNAQGGPTLLKTINGSTWVFQTNSGVSTFLGFNDIFFSDANNGWVTGGNGTIRHTANAGSTPWTSQNSGTLFELLGLDFTNSSTGYACGREGVIITTANGGTTWAAQSSSMTSGTIWEIDKVNDTLGFAAGDVGLLKYNVYTPSQPIDLLQPNTGGEIFQIGTRRFIIWQVQAGITNVKIEYSTSGNAGPWSTIIASTPASTGSYSWVVPNTPSVNCYVRISNTANSNTLDISNAAFYILNTPYGLDYSVLTSATVSDTPPQITVTWNTDVNALSYTIGKKLPSDTSWTHLDSLSGTTTSYTDTAVTTGTIYEYRLVKTTPLITGYGYLYSGIDIPAQESRGTLLLAVDENFSGPLEPEINQLKFDLIGEGWKVIQQNFPATAKDTTIKNWVISQYNQPGSSVQSLLLIGHFAIPYSGNFAPDGHPERIGAQPADVFYADMDGAWTDSTVTTNNTGNIYTPNVPFDGKWDQSVIPSPGELMVGRIDMKSMDGFALNEVELLQQYLNKNHHYRHKIMNPDRRALLNTHIDQGLPPTSAVAWRSFAPMIGSANIAVINTAGCTGNGTCHIFTDSLQAHSYVWTYMAGGGSDTSCANPVFTSSHCINLDLHTVFMQLYGSYFVEWAKGGVPNTVNHLLRAPLANAGMPLATCWTGGMPRWYFHQMGLGESIGFSTLQSQNNTGIYDLGNNQLTGGVHMVLMGDPTLRLHTVHPVTDLTATQMETSLQLNWTASADTDIVGYHVYRADTIYGDFIRLNTGPVGGTQFTDSMPSPVTNNVYMVRAIKSETSPSGRYQHMSTGVFVSKNMETTFTFTGNGSWTSMGNWNNNLRPPVTLPSGFSIVVQPLPGGECLLESIQHIAPGAGFTIVPGSVFRIAEQMFIH